MFSSNVVEISMEGTKISEILYMSDNININTNNGVLKTLNLLIQRIVWGSHNFLESTSKFYLHFRNFNGSKFRQLRHLTSGL